jgi:hypothetical protein
MEAIGSCRSSLRKRISEQCVAFIAKLSLQELCIRLSPSLHTFNVRDCFQVVVYSKLKFLQYKLIEQLLIAK